MASLYKQQTSKFWWVKYRDPNTHAIKRESTGFRISSARETRAAKSRCAELTWKESLTPGKSRTAGSWDTWVCNFLNTRYASNATTLERYSSAWKTLRLYLTKKEIHSPRQLTRKHCFEYIAWRQQPDDEKYTAGHNTALLELKLLRIIMQEAVERELCPGNPCTNLRINRHPPKVKPEITPDLIARIREAIAQITNDADREFYHLSFEIARFQGCRLKETCLNPMRDVTIFTKDNAKQGRIRFLGKGRREFVTLLHPELIPLFEKLQAAGRTHTWTTPPGRGRQWASGKWFRFLRDHGFKAAVANLCFHSTRVTVVTELFRNNVPESKARNYVNHASTTTHRIYQRALPTDLDDCIHAVGKTAG